VNGERSLHADLRTMFAAGIEAVSGEAATRRACRALDIAAPIRLVAFGKAAGSMARGALDALDDRERTGGRVVDALVISKHGHLDETLRRDPRLVCLESSHPVPDRDSLAAGGALLARLGDVADDEHLLVLISGGGSALVEALVEGVDLSGLRARTEALLGNGAAIGEINRVRRGLSRIKGGGALAACGGCGITQLLISDVPGDVVTDIASGPFVAPDTDAGTGTGARAVDTRVIASNAIARRAAAGAATGLGYTVLDHDGSLDGDIDAVRVRVEAGLPDEPGTVRIWGGEPTVSLPASPGRGGRNQHLAASLVPMLALHHAARIAVLVCGTDGTDGPTDAAGGLVDGDSLVRGTAAGVDLAVRLAAADSGTWLEAAGALVRTGPTGTNVMDLAIAVRGRGVQSTAHDAGDRAS